MTKSFKHNILLTVVVFLFLSFTQQESNRYFDITKNIEIFASLYKQVNEYYVDEINPNQLMQVGIDAMLESLDPYTNYISEDRIEDFRTESTGQYAGIGASIMPMDDKIVVTGLIEGFPAHTNGLEVGDEILAVNGIDITDRSYEDVSLLLKGQTKTKVSLEIRRYGIENPFTLDFTREKVQIESVPAISMINDQTGYFKLSEFTMHSGRQVKKAVEELKERGAEQLIFDLRGNPGGLLVEAVNITNIFIPKGLEVVSTRGKISQENVSFKTLNSPTDTDIPLVILVSSGSASASEIVAGTLQDYDRAVILGRKSYGKGLVQVSRPLSYNSQLKVTTSKYYTPSGRCIQALDYSNRNRDGSVGKVPDSLKQSFLTQNGRVVYDGGGIDPDIVVTRKQPSRILETLMENGFIFNYATEYFHKHPEINPARDFVLSDEEFAEFTKWVQSQSLSYQTEVETELVKIKNLALEEGYYQDIKDHFDKLEKLVSEQKSKDIFEFRSEIKNELEKEIIGRYYFEGGVLLSSFDKDRDIIEAIKILNNSKTYDNILNPGGNQ